MKKKNGQNILFVAPFMESFIRGDIGILSTQYEVLVNIYPWSKKKYTLWFMFRQFCWILVNFRKLYAIVISFGGYWAFVPAIMGRIFRIPVYIIVHGTDCASIPSLRYGMLRKNPLRTICRWSYALVTMILPVSESLLYIKNEHDESTDEHEQVQGLKHFFPDLRTPFKIIYNGLDDNFWKVDEEIDLKEENAFISVLSKSQYLRKGGDLIVHAARRFPEATFYIAGISGFEDQVTLTENVIFLGRLTPEELRSYYRKSSFYLQLSVFEGFGCALCEAMLTECIAIGSSVNMIPDIIGETGFILQKREFGRLEEIIQQALSISDRSELGKLARNRVIKNYSLERRRNELLNVLSTHNFQNSLSFKE